MPPVLESPVEPSRGHETFVVTTEELAILDAAPDLCAVPCTPPGGTLTIQIEDNVGIQDVRG